MTIIGTIITDGWLTGLQLPEICAWLCLFLEERRIAKNVNTSALELPKPSKELHEVFCQAHVTPT